MCTCVFFVFYYSSKYLGSQRHAFRLYYFKLINYHSLVRIKPQLFLNALYSFKISGFSGRILKMDTARLAVSFSKSKWIQLNVLLRH